MIVYERRHPRRSADDRLVDRFTRRESAAARTRRIARLRVTVPQEVAREFEQSLDTDTVRYARAIAQELTHAPDQETRTMKRTPTTKRAEPTPATTKPEPTAVTKPTAKTATKKPKVVKKKAAKKATPSDRATILAKYMADKLRIQKQVKIGATLTYHGRNESIDGKPVKVTGYEARNGIWVEHRGEKYVVAPRALLKPTK